MQITTLIYLLFGAIALESLTLAAYILITKPVAFPYLLAKLKNGTLLILKTETGQHVLINTDRHYKTKRYGQFLPNLEAIFHIGGMPCAYAYSGMAVPPSEGAREAGEKLAAAHATAYGDLETTATKAEEKGILTKKDVQALYSYANNVSPTFVESRIEHRVAEILASNRDNLGKLMGYAIVFVIIMLGAGVAIYMAGSGASAPVAETVAAATSLSI